MTAFHDTQNLTFQNNMLRHYITRLFEDAEPFANDNLESLIHFYNIFHPTLLSLESLMLESNFLTQVTAVNTSMALFTMQEFLDEWDVDTELKELFLDLIETHNQPKVSASLYLILKKFTETLVILLRKFIFEIIEIMNQNYIQRLEIPKHLSMDLLDEIFQSENLLLVAGEANTISMIPWGVKTEKQEFPIASFNYSRTTGMLEKENIL
ncbi:MAG: hypothetical protein ACW98K_14765 [Candidatus Kariarchaeaceae archaeon]